MTVKPSETYQVMKGWVVLASFWEQDKRRDRYDPSWLRYRDLILDRLVNELGINRIRIEIKSGAENPVDYWTLFRQNKIGYKEAKRHNYEKINDNEDPNLVNMADFQFSHLPTRARAVLLVAGPRCVGAGLTDPVRNGRTTGRWGGAEIRGC